MNSNMTHQEISFLKSAIRFIGYALIPLHLPAAAVVLIVSEVIGVMEEIGH
jgi:hypothetical protein